MRAGGCVEDVRVGGTGEVLVVDGVDIVAGAAEYVDPSWSEVFVELELHATST